MTGSSRRWDWTQTIVAAATGSGPGVRAILRVSGPEAHRLVAASLADPAPLPWSQPRVFRATWRVAAWRRTFPVDVYVWPEERSYTGQPAAEMHLPACPPLLAELETQLIGGGARRALPGEFSLRAFLAGRIDLLQAEGVLGLVEARNLAQLRWAVDQHTGGLSRPLTAVRNQLLDLLADLEAGLDFLDQDIRFVADTEAIDRLRAAQDELRSLLEKLGRRALDQNLPRIVLVGDPNVGKSSLFNRLVGSTQALVSREPGTTRDYLTARVRIGEQWVELIDTAGFDQPGETIAAQAAERRQDLVESCDLVLQCVPAGAPWPEDAPRSARWLRVRSQCDLAPQARDRAADCHVTVTTAAGTGELLAVLSARLRDLGGSEGGVASQATARLQSGLERALADVEECLRLAAAAQGHEILAIPLRDAIEELGELVGVVYTDDLLDRIFSRFCLGK